MPRREYSHAGRHSWSSQVDAGDAASRADRHRGDWPVDVAKFRPPWWPENEPWPPKRRHWARGTHRPFFRRLGCLFLLLNWFAAAVLISVAFFVLNALGVTSVVIHQVRWIAPVGGILLAVMISVTILAGTNLRRMSVPLDDLLAASQRVAEGDYSVRVRVHGPLEVRTLAAAFNSMTEKLEYQDGQRRAMLADVSHELRTPLTVIQGNIEGVLDGLYPADEARLRSILEETQILSRLTDDLRTLALAESGSLRLELEQANLVALTRETLGAFQSQADAGGVRAELSSTAPEITVNIDPERIRQVLSNLISNALRYSPRDSTVSVGISSDEKGIKVAVADSGPGIAAADIQHVFDRYYKSADSRGMGLGLSIAKYIVEAHGGQIQAERGDGRGTTISFTLPA